MNRGIPMRAVLLTMILLVAVYTQAMAGMVKLSWDYEGEGHMGFRLYYGGESHVGVSEPLNPVPEHEAGTVIVAVDPAPYDAVVDIMDPGARTYEISLPNGRYYFRMVTVGAMQDSAFTETEPSAYIGLNPPTNVRVEWIFMTPR